MLQNVETTSVAHVQLLHFISLSELQVMNSLQDKSGNFLVPSLEKQLSLLEYAGESGEEACKRVSWVVRDLAEQGQYGILGSRDFRDTLEQYVSQCGTEQEQNTVRYSSVEWFVKRSYHRIEHQGAQDDAPIPFGRFGTGRSSVVRQVFTLFRQVGEMQQVIQDGLAAEQVFCTLAASRSQSDIYDVHYIDRQTKHIQYQQKITQAIGQVMRTKLIHGKHGILRERLPSEKNSNAQREKLLLLLLPGLSKWEFGAIVDRVILPPNASRADTGRVPAAIYEALSELRARKSVSTDPEFSGFVDSIQAQALHDWPTPGDESRSQLAPELKVYFVMLQLLHYGWLMP